VLYWHPHPRRLPSFPTRRSSDLAALNDLVRRMVECCTGIHCLRDPTRGGLATTLNELARQSGVGMTIFENRIPITDAVTGACERSEEHTSELQSRENLVCRLLLE